MKPNDGKTSRKAMLATLDAMLVVSTLLVVVATLYLLLQLALPYEIARWLVRFMSLLLTALAMRWWVARWYFPE